MSEIDLKSTKPKEPLNAKPQEHAPESESARLNWYEKVYHPPVSDLKGNQCRVQPRPGQIAYLEAGKVTRGCDYRTFTEPEAPVAAGHESADTGGRIDIPSLFREERPKSVYIEEKERERHHKKDSYFSGSGVIVGKRGDDELLILTDNHVVGGDRGSKLKEVKVRTPDGVAC
jgi:S1-C subfamily serine protease